MGSIIQTSATKISRRQALGKIALATASGLAWGGCGKGASSIQRSNKIRVGMVGITCEAPLVAAVEKGFFKEEGLEPEVIRCDWKNYKDALALGQYDITHHLIMFFLKPIEQGLDVKFTGGIHRGCLRVQVPVNSPIKTIKDLAGKRIAAPGMGTPPFIFANRVLGANGVDPRTGVTWLVYPNAELGLALDKGDVDAVADSEPIGSMLVAQGKVRNIADQAADDPYKNEYCCAVILSGKYIKENPEKAAGGTRALLKAAKWVEANPKAAAALAVEKKYLASTADQNAFAISHLRYIPSVSGAQKALVSAADEMKIAGMLNASTDVAKLAKDAFMPLEGVSDQWINNLPVEHIAGAQATEKWLRLQYAKYNPSDPFCTLCITAVN
jgi:NitT/TauT family transport system substrate-binding protein